MGREQRDTGVREEALGRRHVVEGGGGVGAERQDERRPPFFSFSVSRAWISG